MINKKVESIQLLRAFAVSLVIFVHASYFGIPHITNSNPIDSFYYIKSWGCIGVDLFFTISGFIMTVVVPSYQQSGGWKKFFLKRIIRIIPLYFLLSLVDVFVTIYIKKEPIDFQTIAKTIVFFPFFDGKSFVEPVISVGWTLSYEIYFYSLIGVVLSLGKKIYRNLLIIIMCLSLIGCLFTFPYVFFKFITSPLLLEFGFGILCGLTYKKFRSLNWDIKIKQLTAVLLLFGGLFLMFITIFVKKDFEISHQNIVENNNLLALYRVIIWGIPCALFLLGTILVEQLYTFRIWKILIEAGDSSYSSYLIHGQIYPILAIIFHYFDLSVFLYLLFVIPVCICVSIIFFRIVEKPLIIIIDKILKFKKPVILKS